VHINIDLERRRANADSGKDSSDSPPSSARLVVTICVFAILVVPMGLVYYNP